MQVKVKKEQIISGLQKAASIIPSKSGAAYLRSIWLEAKNEKITLFSTDANIEFMGTYSAHVEQEGRVGVNGRAFMELLRRLPQDEITLTFKEEESTLFVEQGRRSYKMPTADPVWFQALAPFPEEGSVLWSGDIFEELLDKVTFCINDGESSDALSCLFMVPMPTVGEGKVDICGLNGHQFAMVRFVNDDIAAKLEPQGLLIPKKYVLELRKWLGTQEVQFNISERRFHIRMGADSAIETLSLPRALAVFPSHTSFIDRLNIPEVSLLEVNRKECLEALERIQIFNSENEICTYFSFAQSELVMHSKAQETGSATEVMDASYKGDLTRIAFPTRNLMDILNHFTSANVTFTFTGMEGPCGIRGMEDPDYTVIIMPMKIVEESYYEE